MATPPTRAAFASPSSGNYTTSGASKVTTAFDVQAGDLIVVVASSEQAGTNSVVTPTASAGSVTWTLRVSQMTGTTNQSGVKVWTGAVSATATGITVTVPRINTGTALWWGCSATVWRGHGGVGQAVQANSGTASSVAQTTTASLAANSAVQIAMSDWNAIAVASRSWQTVNGAAMTESLYANGASHATAYGAYRTDVGAAGTKVVGLTTPATLRWVIGGVEILGSSASSPGQGSGTGAVAFSGSAAGKRVARATSAGSVAFAGSSAGKRSPKANATGSVGFTGSASGKRVAKASSSGTVTITGTASGTTVRRGTGSGAIGFAGAATGKRNPRASGNGTLAFVGTVTGKRTPKATGTSGLTFTSAAVGNSPTPGLKEGFGLGSVGWTGTAAGRRTPKGGGSGTVALVGSSVGVRTPLATGVGSLAYVGVAVGEQPGPPTEFQGRILAARITAPTALGVVVVPGAAGDLSAAAVTARLSILKARGVIT